MSWFDKMHFISRCLYGGITVIFEWSLNKYKDIRYAKGEPPYFHSPQKQETVMKWADLCPGSVLFLFIPSSWGPTVAFTSIFTYTIPASLKLDMSYKQTIRLWGWDRDRQKVWGIAKLESACWRSSNMGDDKFVQVCEGLDGIRDVDSGDSTCWSSTEAVIIIITVPPSASAANVASHFCV